MKTVTSAVLAGAASLIRDYGADPQVLARLAGFEPAALSETDIVLDAKAVLRFFDISATACKDRYFGIELSKLQGFEILGPVWLLARHASNLEEALDNIAEAMQLHSNALVLRGVRESKGIAYCYDTVSGDAAGELQAIELAYALLIREIRVQANRNWLPGYVQFRHSSPKSLRRHRQEFGDSISFNQDRNALLVDFETLSLPLQTGDKLHLTLKREMHKRMHMVSENFPARVDMIIRNLISSDACDSHIVAASLGVTIRTLQNKLADCGTSYQKILDNVRESLACKYLRESDLSIAEIAELLHFSETSAFSRFFSQRKGISPRAFRKQCS